jgi:hypothetical protein
MKKHDIILIKGVIYLKKNFNYQVSYEIWENFQALAQKTGIKKNKLCETAILLLLEKFREVFKNESYETAVLLLSKEVVNDEDNKERNNNNSTDS